MLNWPKSVSDYKWPRGMLTARHAPARWMRAAVFHACYAAGRAVSFFRSNPPAILAIRTDGVADAVLAEPMLSSLSRRFPGCEFHLWAPEDVCQLLGAARYIQRRMIVPRGFKHGNLQLFRRASLRAALGYRLGRWPYQTVAYLSHSPEPLGNWLMSSARSRQRWYVPGDTANQYAAQRMAASRAATSLFVRTDRLDLGRHDLTRNARVAGQWGDGIEQRLPHIELSESAAWFAGEQIELWRGAMKWYGANTLIGLMPAPSSAAEKYPPGAWAIALAELWRSHRVLVALLSTPDNGEAAYEIATRLGSLPHVRLNRPINLLSLAAVIGSLDGFLTVDGGLAQVALAQDVPTVALVSPCNPSRFFPWPIPRRATILYQTPSAENRPSEFATRIDPMEIVRATQELMFPAASMPLRIAG
jgi:ADP-heptose:LPS heptosyltransferase